MTAERGVKGKKMKVEEAAAEACEPQLAEIIVSEKVVLSHSLALPSATKP